MKPMHPSPANNQKLDLIHKKETKQCKEIQIHHNDHKYATTNSLSWKSIRERERDEPPHKNVLHQIVTCNTNMALEKYGSKQA